MTGPGNQFGIRERAVASIHFSDGELHFQRAGNGLVGMPVHTRWRNEQHEYASLINSSMMPLLSAVRSLLGARRQPTGGSMHEPDTAGRRQ